MEESGVRWFWVCGALSAGWCSGPRLAQSQDMLFQGPGGGSGAAESSDSPPVLSLASAGAPNSLAARVS